MPLSRVAQSPAIDATAVGAACDETSSDGAARVREVVAREYAFVWRFLRRLGVPEASVDDAAQAVFVRVLARHSVVRVGSERAYLMKAALHLSFEYRRAHKRAASRSSELDV